MKMNCIFNPVGKWYYRAICYVLLFALSLMSFGCILMDRILFPTPSSDGQKAGNLTLHAGDVVLDALWMPCENPKAVILYSHGNGEYLSKIKPWLEKFTQHNYSILAYDYAGYGGSTGKAGEKQAYLDIEAAYNYLTQTEKIAPDQIIVTGFSVGSGPSSYIAEKYPVKGLVLAAPFASAIQVVLPFSLPFDRFENAERLSRKEVPVLIFHGTRDWIVPYRNSKTIFKKASGRKKFVTITDAGHNDIFLSAGDKFWKEIENHLLQ